MDLYNIYTEGKLVKEKRDKLKPVEFGLPEDRQYPLVDADHVRKAIQLFDKCDESKRKQLANNIFLKSKEFHVAISKDSLCFKYLSDKDKDTFKRDEKMLNEELVTDMKIDSNFNYSRLDINDDSLEMYRDKYSPLRTILPNDQDNLRGFILVNNNGDDVVGYIQGNIKNKTLIDLNVNPLYRRQGIGSKLLDSELGKDMNQVRIDKDNEAGVNFLRNKFSDKCKEINNSLYFYRNDNQDDNSRRLTESVDNINLLSDDFDNYIEGMINESYSLLSESSQDELQPLYIVCVRGDTPVVSKVIKKVTGSPYTHALIGFDDKLEHLYSYKKGGFTIESIKQQFNQNQINKGFDYMVIKCAFLKKSYIDVLKNKIKFYKNNADQTHFSIWSLFKDLVNDTKHKGNDMNMCCSEFVGKLLQLLDIKLFDKETHLYTPKDFGEIKHKRGIYSVYEGRFAKFKPSSFINKVLKFKKHAKVLKEDYISCLLQEFDCAGLADVATLQNPTIGPNNPYIFPDDALYRRDKFEERLKNELGKPDDFEESSHNKEYLAKHGLSGEYDTVDIYNEKLETFLIRGRLPKKVTIYHGTSAKLDNIIPNSYNIGTRISSARSSSYWFIKKEYAIAFAILTVVESNINIATPICLDGNFKFMITDKYKDKVIDILKKHPVYVYEKRNIESKLLGSGESRGFPEYTLDFPVKPDVTNIIPYSPKLLEYINFVTAEEIEQHVKDIKAGKNVYGKVGFFDKMLHYKFNDVAKKKKELKKLNKGETEEVLNEGYVFNEPDILYNKDKFDSGEINLCFITGLSGSGKTTMAREMAKDKNKKDIEYFRLDDLMIVKDYFTMEDLKKYSDLAYSYFNGIGKKFYLGRKELENMSDVDKEYYDILFPEFINYSMKYANSHKNKRFVIEGIWIYCGSDLDHYFSPKDFKDYAFYIKGTSALISHIRMAKRDAVKKSGLKKIGTFIKLSILYQGYYINSEKRLKVFRDYFKQLLSEECLQAFLSESSSSKFQYIDLKDSRVDDYMNKSSQSNYWKKYSSYHKSNSRGEIVIDSENDELAGYIFVKNKKSGEDGYITPLFVIKKYRKNGLSHQLADDAVKKYKATDLLVKKDNKIAINLYKKHGFVIVEHNDNRYKDYYYMKLKSKLNNNDKVYKKEGK